MLPIRHIAQAVLPGLFGPLVIVVRTLMDGAITREAMPAALAVEDVLRGPQNGVTVRSAHIEWGSVFDGWGSSA